MSHGGNVWTAGRPAEWLDFSANLRPEGPPPWIMEALGTAAEKVRFYPDPDMRQARKGLASFLGLPEECVLPTAGGIEAIDLSLTLTGGSVCIQSPTFCEYALRAAVQKRRVAEWNGCCARGDSLVLCNPNNPTGRVKSRDELLALHALIRANAGNLIVDEAFIEFCPEYSVRDYADSDLIVLGSLSKILGIPGVRLGYLCASPGVVARLMRSMRPWPLDAAAAEIAAQLPEHREEIRRDAERNRQRRGVFGGLLQSLGAEVYPSAGNFLLADFHRDMSSAAEKLKGRKILVRTCADFGLPGSFWRLAVKTEEENRCLISALEDLQHAW